MNTRYKITRLDAQGNPTLSLEECKAVFAAQSDFLYSEEFGASQDGVHMKIKGHFFMWQVENVQIPFRFFDGEVYVAVSHPAILDKAIEIARLLEAVYVEG
jgi:hypothetical protein